MTFRRSAPAALIAAIAIVVASMAFLSNRLFSGLTESIEASQFQLMQSIVETTLRNAEEDALARAEIIATLRPAREGVAARDYTRLLAEYEEMFTVQKERHGVDQAQFHVPPAMSLLRLHAPAQRGDDLTRFRPMVVAVNKEHASRKGLAVARGGPAIFGVAPLHGDNGEHIGSFEFGVDFGPILDAMKAAYGLELALFIEEKPLREFAAGVNPSVFGEQNRVGRFVRFHTTHGPLLAQLAKAGDIGAVNEPTHYTRNALGVPYGVLLMPLRNSAGAPLGLLAVARDFSGSRAAAGRSLVWQVTLAVFAIVILAGAVLVVLRGFLIRPLGIIARHIGMLAAGDSPPPLEDPEDLCIELRELAAHYERLRHAEGKDGQPEGR